MSDPVPAWANAIRMGGLHPLVRGRRMRAVVVSVVVHAFVGASASVLSPPVLRAQSIAAQAAPCDIRTSERIVAVGDVHGAHDQFLALLRTLSLIDQRNRWSGGRAILVQTGDVLDRGHDSRKTLDFLRRLEGDARRAGGQVHALVGNHEVMRMIGDWRYVSPEEFMAFRRADSNELREEVYRASLARAQAAARVEQRQLDTGTFRQQFMKDVPLGALEMRQAFSGDGEYGRWLRTHVAMVIINGIAFVHGGVSPSLATLGCRGINAAVAKDLSIVQPTAAEGAAMFSSQEVGPLWYRGLVTEGELTSPQVNAILASIGARAMVVGHTVSPTFRPLARFDARVMQIDTGMLGGTNYSGGQAAALEIVGDTFTAVFLDGRQRLPSPGPVPTAAEP